MPTLIRPIAILIIIAAVVPTRAASDDAIQKAIKNGAKYLQAAHKPHQGYNGGSHTMGSATLAGLALLESGVDETDPSLANIIKYVRQNALAQTGTYEISLTIMFLDRLGNPGDRPFIQLLGVRLLAGQGRAGGWSYDCGNALNPQEQTRLRNRFLKESRLKLTPHDDDPVAPPKKESPKVGPRTDLPTGTAPPPNQAVRKSSPKPADDKPALHPEVVKWAKLISSGADPRDMLIGGVGDNSNTQFAALGIWVAHRHGVPIARAAALLDKRFRATQEADGGWNYTSMIAAPGPAGVPGPPLGVMPGMNSTPAMTCAGLIGLAVGHGSQNLLRNKADAPGPKGGDKDPTDDPAVKKGLRFLAASIANAKRAPAPVGGRPPLPAMPVGGQDLTSNLYFLWSLERTAVIFGLETIGNQDWYKWGADALVARQAQNGAWSGFSYHGADDEISTSFALLFLNRANVAKDLSAALRGKVKDPGMGVLRGGREVGAAGPERKSPPADPVKPPVKLGDPPPATVTGNDFEKEAARLCAALVGAAADERPAVLARLRDSKGSVHTEALARGAARLSGEAQREAREALAQRLKRMTAATLREMLRDRDREVRLAAATACGLKEDRQLVADLISTLGDADAMVVQASRASLRALSGKDFGPEMGATAGDRSRAILAWKDWLKEQTK